MSTKKKVFYTISLATFLMFIALPNLLMGANDSVDVSIIFSVAEEETKESEKDLGTKFLLSLIQANHSYSVLPLQYSYSSITTENYAIPLLNKSYPPPRI